MHKILDDAYDSALKNVHPTEKFVFVLSFLFMTLFTQNCAVALFTLMVMSMSIVWWAKIPFRQYMKLLLIPSLFLISGIIAVIISVAPIDSERTLHAIWRLKAGIVEVYVSRSSIVQAFRLAATVMASVSCLYFLILTTPLQQLLWFCQKIKLPSLLTDLMVFIYRFIFILLDRMNEIYRAQSSRLGYQNYRVSVTSTAQLIVNLFLKSALAARDLQMAIDSRIGGGESGEKGLFVVELTMQHHRWHWVGIISSLAALFAVYFLLNK